MIISRLEAFASQHNPSLVFSETENDLELPHHLEHLVRPYHRRTLGTWSHRDLLLIDVSFSYWGRQYIIGPSRINRAGRGLFILQDVHVPSASIVTLMSYGGP